MKSKSNLPRNLRELNLFSNYGNRYLHKLKDNMIFTFPSIYSTKMVCIAKILIVDKNEYLDAFVP